MIEPTTRKEPTSIHWTDATEGNKWLKRISPAMLVGEGVPEPRFIKLPGAEEKEYVRVMYDRDYVFAKVVKELMEQMNFDTIQRCLLFMCDVWDFWQHNTDKPEPMRTIREFLGGAIEPARTGTPVELRTWVLRGDKVVKLDDFKAVLSLNGVTTEESGNVLVCK